MIDKIAPDGLPEIPVARYRHGHDVLECLARAVPKRILVNGMEFLPTGSYGFEYIELFGKKS
jgi:hypothetical protein